MDWRLGKLAPALRHRGTGWVCRSVRILLLIGSAWPWRPSCHAEQPPLILKQPVDVTAAYGDSVTLRVEAIGPGLEYQWQKRTGKNWFHYQAVGTHDTLPFTNLTPGDAGIYRVIITSAGFGSVISREATLSFPADAGTDRIRVVKQAGRVRAGVPVGGGVVMNGQYFYPGYDPDGGVELWVTDGTGAGTRRVRDARPGVESGFVVVKGSKPSLAAFNGRVYFTGDDGENGRALWTSDGTAGGTQMLQAEFLFVNVEGTTQTGISVRVGESGFGTPQKLNAFHDLEITDFTPLGGMLYFRASSSGVAALGRTDGSPAGTRNLYPSETTTYWDGASINKLAVFTEVQAITPGPPGKFFFIGNSEQHGRELWISDGTDPGTRLVSDLRPYSADGIVAASLTAHLGKVYFMARHMQTGLEPWVSDGTSEGTFRLRDIFPGSGSSLAFEFTVFAGEVYFSAQSPTGMGLWRTDGSTAGTSLVKELLGVSRLRAANALIGSDRLFFMGRDAEAGFELWVSDGTPSGTSRVADLVPGSDPSSPLPLGTQQGSLYFLTESPEAARALWISNGSDPGTVRLTPSAAFLKQALLRSGNTTYFAAFKTEGGRELQIFKTDGTATNTIELSALPWAKTPDLQWADLGARKLLNTAAFATADFRTGDFVVTDGTSAGTSLLDLPSQPGSFGGLTPFKDGLLFAARVDEQTAGLFRADGLTTTPLKLFAADNVQARTAVSPERALFLLNTESETANAFHTDGTAVGTKEVHLRGAFAANPSGIGVLGETFLLAHSPTLDPETLFPTDLELYRVNANGTLSLVKQLQPATTSSGKPLSSYPTLFSPLGGSVYFFTVSPNALWRTDGTATGTVEVEPLNPLFVSPLDAGSADHLRPGVLGNRLFFSAAFPYTYPAVFPDLGFELWKSGGKTLNTVQLRDIYPGTHWVYSDGFLPMPGYNSSQPAQFTRVGDQLFFAATSPQGRELWKTDGTASGTVMVKDLSTGDEEEYDPVSAGLGFLFDVDFPVTTSAANKTNPTNLFAVAGRLYFVARDNEGTKLYRSDGTAGDTVPIEPQRLGYGPPHELTECNGRLYYRRAPLGLPAQIWEYDPVLDSHRALTSLAGGVANPAQLTASAGRLYFVGDDGNGATLFAYERVPFFKEHPASQTLLAGGEALLSVSPTNSELSYSWRRGFGHASVLGTNASLTIAAADVTRQPISVRVSKPGLGTQISQPAHLRVLDAVTSQNIRDFPDSWWTMAIPEPDPATPAIPGTLDPSWGTSNMVNGTIVKIIALPDGKILIGGTFSEVTGKPAANVARLLHDGTLDPTFSVGAGPAGGIADMAVAADGGIFIAGGFLTVDGYQRERVARLHPDGAVDLDFKPPIAQPGEPQVLAVLPAADGKVYIGGIFGSWDGHETVSVARLHANGTVDTTFKVTNQPNTGGPFRVAAMAFYPGEANPQQLLVGGGTYYVEPGNGVTNQRRHVARLETATGVWDTSFNLAPIPNPPASIDGSVSKIVPLADGKILVGGVQGGGHTTFDGMLRLNANGSLDTSFLSGPTAGIFGPGVAAAPFRTFELLPTGQIVAGGRFSSVQGSMRSNVAQLLPDGMRDPSFVPGDGPNNEVTAIGVQAGGGILIAGSFTRVNGAERRGLARLHGNPAPPVFVLDGNRPLLDVDLLTPLEATLRVDVLGSPPPTVTWYFEDEPVGSGPILTVNQTVPANQGTYYAVVENSFGVTVTSPITMSFDSGPPVITEPPRDAPANPLGTAVFAVQATGALPLQYQWKRNGQPIAGETNRILRVFVADLQAGGDDYTVEVRNFLQAAESSPARVVLSRIGTRNSCFYHYTLPAGINDHFIQCQPPTAFDFPNYTPAESVAYQPGGFVVIGGGAFTRGSQWSDSPPPYLMRFTEWGARAYDGEGRPDATVRKVATGPDGSVYVAGDFKNVLHADGSLLAARPGLAKYDADLRFVAAFAPTILPASAQVTALLVQPDGKVLVGGTFSNVNGVATLGVVRLLSDGQNDPAFHSGITYLNYAVPRALALQSDGKILLGGQGAYYGAGAPPSGEFRNQLCRLNPEGSWDSSFETTGGAANAGYVESVNRIVVQPDDRILISGFIARWGGVNRNGLARLLPDGALDPSFDPGSGPDATISSMALLPDGRVMVTGSFSSFDGVNRRGIVRLRGDGSVDEGYYPPTINAGRDLVSLPDGGAMVVGSFNSGPFTPPTGEPTVSTREWVHPITGSTHVLHTYTFEAQCPGHGPELGPIAGDICGTAHTWLNGVMRLHGTEGSPQPPLITLQPQGVQSLAEGGVLTLFVGAVGDGLTYQWRKNGVNLANETKPILRLDSLAASQSGNYSVVISNALGTVVSEAAVVKVVAGSNPRGTFAISPDTEGFEWRFTPAPGRSFTLADAEGLTLEASEDLKNWFVVPGAVTIRNGALVWVDPQPATLPGRYYRLVAGAKPVIPAATADPGTAVAFAALPATLRQRAEAHVQAFINVPPELAGEEEANWTDVMFAPQARLLHDPAYQEGNVPAYVELKLVSAHRPSDERGYILLSLTEDDSPVVEFATRGPAKTEHLLRGKTSGVVTRFMRFGRGFVVGEDAVGQPHVTLGTAPMKLVSEAPPDLLARRAGFLDATGVRGDSSPLGGDWVPFSSYDEMKLDARINPIRVQARQRRAAEAASRWRTVPGSPIAVLALPPGETREFLTDQAIARVEVLADDAPAVAAEALRNGGVRLTALRGGSEVIRVELMDGRVERYTAVVSAKAGAGIRPQGGCDYHVVSIPTGWVAGNGFADQRRYDQMSEVNHPNWCPSVGCGPTALAMLFGWWDAVRNVPSIFYTLDAGRGKLDYFRFSFESLRFSDAPFDLDETTERQKLIALYEDLHELCNTICLAGSGATAPDQMVSAFHEYVSRVFAPELPEPMGEYGGGFVGATTDHSYVWPGGLTDWEGGGKIVAAALKLDQGGGEGRPGIVGFDWHYALAYAYRRVDVYAGCAGEEEKIGVERWFRCNMGWGGSPEWHDATDVWFGLTANFWQRKIPLGTIGSPIPLDQILGALGTGSKLEVHRPAVAVQPVMANPKKVFVLEGDNRGLTPTSYTRMSSANSGASFSTPLLPGVGNQQFKSGPAIVGAWDGNTLHAFGLGPDKYFHVASSTDGGVSWPNPWLQIFWNRQFSSAPAAAASLDLATIYIAGIDLNGGCVAGVSTDGGQNWPISGKSLGGAFKSAPALATSFDGRIAHIFGLGTDDRIWRGYTLDRGTNWVGWAPIGLGIFRSAPAAAMSLDGQTIHVVGRGTDQHYWRYVSFDGGVTWQGAAQVPAGVWSSGPDISLDPDGVTLRLFGRGVPPTAPDGTIPDPSQPRVWMGISPDGGNTWPGGFNAIVPQVE